YASKAPFQLPDEKKILAYLPGTVLEIKVKPGDKVAAGEELLSFEAMKMRNTIQSPVSGVIASVCVEPGCSFAKGVVLFELA
ncbi:MAG: acetyl-CoA carboxylase biotin carboxyl carrier protein subunit, partial [Bacteroidales bacterium]